MIDNMASLKQAMEQMDADDATVAQAAKDRAAQILSDAKLSFSKLAEAIEQQRLLLRPRIGFGSWFQFHRGPQLTCRSAGVPRRP